MRVFAVKTSVASILAATALLVGVSAPRAETADDRALRDFASHDNLERVAQLLAAGANPNVADSHGRTAVHRAAENAAADALRALLEAGGNADAAAHDGRTPLHLAAAFPYDDGMSRSAIRELLRAWADPDRPDAAGRTPLHEAAREHAEAGGLRLLLDAGADPDRADREGNTPLHMAVDPAGVRSPEAVEALVTAGANGSIANAGGDTPLLLFARTGTNDSRIVRALVAAGSDPDRKNAAGETPLHTTIRYGGNAERPRTVQALLAAGADPCIQDAAGYIPYNIAREGGAVHGMLADDGGSEFDCASSVTSGEPDHRPAVGDAGNRRNEAALEAAMRQCQALRQRVDGLIDKRWACVDRESLTTDRPIAMRQCSLQFAPEVRGVIQEGLGSCCGRAPGSTSEHHRDVDCAFWREMEALWR